MTFIQPTLSSVLEKIDQLDESTSPLWGYMSAQRMIEHLSDTLLLSCTEHEFPQIVPKEKVQKAQDFIFSEIPMPKNFKAPFAGKDMPLRNSNFMESIEEFKHSWIQFEDYFKTNSKIRTLHPNFGQLSYDQWLRIHSKHVTHHLKQFAINA